MSIQSTPDASGQRRAQQCFFNSSVEDYGGAPPRLVGPFSVSSATSVLSSTSLRVSVPLPARTHKHLVDEVEGGFRSCLARVVSSSIGNRKRLCSIRFDGSFPTNQRRALRRVCAFHRRTHHCRTISPRLAASSPTSTQAPAVAPERGHPCCATQASTHPPQVQPKPRFSDGSEPSPTSMTWNGSPRTVRSRRPIARYTNLSERDQAYARMLFFTLWSDRGGFDSYETGFAHLRNHPAICLRSTKSWLSPPRASTTSLNHCRIWATHALYSHATYRGRKRCSQQWVSVKLRKGRLEVRLEVLSVSASSNLCS